MIEIAYPVVLQPSYSGYRVLVVDSMDNCLCDVENARRETARRIAACLNACRDISTEDLERCNGRDPSVWLAVTEYQDD